MFLLTYGYYSIRYKTKWSLKKSGTIQQVFECCQTTASTNNQSKKLKAEPAQGRDVRRMARFPCQGYVYITLHDGFFDCLLDHPLDHVRYKDISIPEKWKQYIMDNHSDGPTKVCTALILGLQLNELSRSIEISFRRPGVGRALHSHRRQSATFGFMKGAMSGSVLKTPLNQRVNGARNLVCRRIL